MVELHLSPFPVLTTQRLVLRRLRPEDEERIFALRTNEMVNQYIGRSSHTTREDAREFIAKINRSIDDHKTFYWAITLKPQEALIGTITLWNIVPEKQLAELGYELHPDYQGQGLMQEALGCVLDFAFRQIGLTVLEGWVQPANTKSVRLLEKNHFTRDQEAETAAGTEALDGLVIYSRKNA